MTGQDALQPGKIDYRLLRKRLERAVARLGPRPFAAQRDDVVQAAMLRMVKAIEGAGPSTTFSEGYLMRTLYTVTIDEIRSATRRAEIPLDEAATPGSAPDRTDPEKEIISRELGGQILNCLTRLARPRRVAVSLYLLGNSGPDTERALHWSAKRVNNLVYRGLADLRRCLEAKGVTQ